MDEIQIAAVGSEGFVGVSIVLMGDKTPNRLLAQTAVEAAKIQAEQLLDEFNRSDKLRKALLRYSQVLQTQFVQSGICNPFHTVRQRLCRWLLVSSDCLHSDSLDLTQQSLADMLGKHLNQVGRVALDLQKSGLIRYVHGRITILDRKGLETASCECYRIVKKWTDELLDF